MQYNDYGGTLSDLGVRKDLSWTEDDYFVDNLNRDVDGILMKMRRAGVDISGVKRKFMERLFDTEQHIVERIVENLEYNTPKASKDELTELAASMKNDALEETLKKIKFLETKYNK